ncbi:IclR family transcriptional regulator [Salinigranum halophilum]|uniref:IclR family transcriptional regulator n=1 Tax=Salinigranum halophilum TaxID=2565931 RepID=UPI0010A77BAB|nr:helix-turn-helix domain-containing protein [Salinigranum halophilum]
MAPHTKKIKTAENIFTIIQKIAELDRPTCSELSDHVELSVSSIYNYLKTLEEHGYIVEKDSRYRLGLQFLQKGRTARNSYPIMHAATEPVDIISKLIDQYISVFVLEGRSAVMIHEANSHHAVETPAPFLGEPFHLGKVPQGKVMLAYLSDSVRADVLSDLGSETEAGRVRSELEAIRTEGVCVDEGLSHENIWAVAAPVKVGDEIYGSLMISTVLHRIDAQQARQELPNLLVQTVKEVEHRLSRYDFDGLFSS